MAENVLVISDGKIHPPLMGRFWLRYTLAGMQGYKVAHINSMEEILELDMSKFQGLVLYFHHKRISDAALAAFDAFIAGGGGVLAIHSVTASFKNVDDFTDIIGGKFTGHGPVKSFDVSHVSPGKGIFG